MTNLRRECYCVLLYAEQVEMDLLEDSGGDLIELYANPSEQAHFANHVLGCWICACVLVNGWAEVDCEIAMCLAEFSGEGGIRRSAKTQGKSAVSPPGGAKSGALTGEASELAKIADNWETLPDAIKAGILAMIQAAKK